MRNISFPTLVLLAACRGPVDVDTASDTVMKINEDTAAPIVDFCTDVQQAFTLTAPEIRLTVKIPTVDFLIESTRRDLLDGQVAGANWWDHEPQSADGATLEPAIPAFGEAAHNITVYEPGFLPFG